MRVTTRSAISSGYILLTHLPVWIMVLPYMSLPLQVIMAMGFLATGGQLAFALLKPTAKVLNRYLLLLFALVQGFLWLRLHSTVLFLATAFLLTSYDKARRSKMPEPSATLMAIVFMMLAQTLVVMPYMLPIWQLLSLSSLVASVVALFVFVDMSDWLKLLQETHQHQEPGAFNGCFAEEPYRGTMMPPVSCNKRCAKSSQGHPSALFAPSIPLRGFPTRDKNSSGMDSPTGTPSCHDHSLFANVIPLLGFPGS